ncbi:iron-containing alcohol dehydrogenase [Aspergillus ruber CBS 135680]|uniref:Dehydroquinate synthase-like protein n=1 Tax=Aspergillus ruber (strain CBS 135680) TaxID=1388766 RepID=A0A017SS73_ASPRC|nr:Dehydroquinate synthase-like protein [Aspergillus ruber CBS 135680]EYE99439.1 Dehydroquinate synthase-like protein [Aspergillus ruber CBS 135680]
MPETVRTAFADEPRPLLSYGIPFPSAAARHVPGLFNASRVYVICSGSLARNTDSLEKLKSSLGEDKIVGVRIGMKSHTLWSEVFEIVQDAKQVGADLLLTLGAGSLTDGAKIVALALANNIQQASDLLNLTATSPNKGSIRPPTVPIVSIPTSLSAGEYSNFAGGTDDTTPGSNRKHSFSYPTQGPQLIILDPELTSTTPDSIWLSTGVRAVDHCVETLCALRGGNGTDTLDAMARHALGLLVPGLVNCKRDVKDLEARLQCQLGSVDAMAACASGRIQLGASHGIGHQLGPLGVGHGETSCILLPAVCKFNAAHNANNDRQDLVRQFLLHDDIVKNVLSRRGVDGDKVDLGDVLDIIIRELGLPRSLKDVGVGREHLDGLAENSLHDRWCVSNPVPLKEKGQVLEILEKVV